MKQYLVLFLLFLLPGPLLGAEQPFSFVDSSGREIVVSTRSERVVSLVPSVTEMLLRIGAGDQVAGITCHSVLPPQTAGKTIVGGFLHPDLDVVESLHPDVIFYADLQKDVVKRFQDKTVLIQLSARSVAGSFKHIRLLGKLFDRSAQAEKIIAEEQRQLDLIQRKVARIPAKKRLRVMRLMGRDRIMTPGADSFQNDYIRRAGGLAPQFGRKGNIIPVSLEEWQKFNPQLLYGCGGDRQVRKLFEQPGWGEVDAVRNHKIVFFPCDLTCRAATHPGFFVSWLAARIYGDEFGRKEHYVLPEQVVSRIPLALDPEYVESAEIITSDIKDFRNKTLAVYFSQPMAILSSLEGMRTGITTVANHYFPPPSWGLGHDTGLAGLQENTLGILGLAEESTAMLFTGADMDHLSVVRKTFQDMTVTALVTAGVQGNSMRMSRDSGTYYEPAQPGKQAKPGTINIILLTNMKLSPRAMTRAVITATEAKSAALQDLDIRSSYSRQVNQATGTGTDNIIVVEGTGVAIDSSGGHTRMGELLAKAVYEGVQQAIYRQNGLVVKRSVFQRLKERKISLHAICTQYTDKKRAGSLRAAVETLLLQEKYADFLKAVMAVSDDYEKGLVNDPAGIDLWCQAVAAEIAGHPVQLNRKELDGMAPVLAKGLTAILAGAVEVDATTLPVNSYENIKIKIHGE